MGEDTSMGSALPAAGGTTSLSSDQFGSAGGFSSSGSMSNGGSSMGSFSGGNGMGSATTTSVNSPGGTTG